MLIPACFGALGLVRTVANPWLERWASLVHTFGTHFSSGALEFIGTKQDPLGSGLVGGAGSLLGFDPDDPDDPDEEDDEDGTLLN